MPRPPFCSSARLKLYEAFGGCIRSPFELAQLRRVDRCTPDWVVERSGAAAPDAEATLLGAEEVEAGITVRAFRLADGYRLVFDDTGVWDVPAGGGVIRWFEGRETDPRKLEQDLLGRVLPLALHAAGSLCLHGSAVVIGGGGVAFLAPKGYGKSTLAAALVERGALLCTDDVAAVDPGAVPLLRPGVAALRLRSDAFGRFESPSDPEDALAGPKRIAVSLERSRQREPVPLQAVYLLAPAAERTGAAAERRRLDGALAAVAMIRESKLGLLLGATEAPTMLERSGAVADAVPVFQLEYARGWHRLDEVVETIVSWHAPDSSGGR
jgi:hypothetical protein